jgi:hypothetical protein
MRYLCLVIIVGWLIAEILHVVAPCSFVDLQQDPLRCYVPDLKVDSFGQSIPDEPPLQHDPNPLGNRNQPGRDTSQQPSSGFHPVREPPRQPVRIRVFWP